jgi:flagellar hook protein FlgE
MAFQQGLSGLGVATRALDVISSNVANSSTVGFKASSTVFADTFAASMGGGTSSLQVGMGSNSLAVRQAFTQGATTATSNPLDMAIAGNGFFQIERSNGSTAFTRNGQFDLDKNGYIVTSLGERLMGYQTVAADGSVSLNGSTAPRPILVPPEGIGAKATGNSTDPVKIRGNLDSGSVAIPALPAFDPTNPTTYSFTTSAAVYDSLGNQHTQTLFFAKRTPTGTEPNPWDVYTTFDSNIISGAGNTPATATPIRIGFSTAGAFAPPATTTHPISVAITAATLGTGAQSLAYNLDLSSFTQRRIGSAVFEITQDGSPPGEIASVSVGSNGIVQGRYTNGETKDLGQVILATFRNPNGLDSVGDNMWVETVASGQSALAAPGDGLNGTIGSGRVEESNVDMSQELVQMIVQQRNYQANAQSIKTQDQLLQTLINLR